MPVFVWKQSAMYDFVKKHHVGFEIDSLYEIKPILDNLSKEEFEQLAHSAALIGEQLRSGFYTKKAVLTGIENVESAK